MMSDALQVAQQSERKQVESEHAPSVQIFPCSVCTFLEKGREAVSAARTKIEEQLGRSIVSPSKASDYIKEIGE